MSKLSEYKSIEEKSAFFDENIVVNTKKEFDEIFDSIKVDEYFGISLFDTSIFRGVSEAKYKLYTSSQRFWIENELKNQKVYYHDFIRKLIKNCKIWNNGSVPDFFKHSEIDINNSLAYLSYMQHYNVPTPLLDFTDSLFTGLYFAFHGINVNSSNDPIDNYCSLYIVDISEPYLSATYRQFTPEAKRELEIKQKQEEQKVLTNNEIEKREIEFDSILQSYPILVIPSTDNSFKIINNLNISNQDGLFLYNSDDRKPIEENYFSILNDIEIKIGNEKFKRRGFKKKFAFCINFHKNLKEYVLFQLNQEKTNGDYIFPNVNNLAKNILYRTLMEL